jgi:hypothetical protein
MLLLTIAWLAFSASSVFAAPNSLGLRATYDVVAHVHWSRAAMTVTTTAHVTNTSGQGVETLVFNLLPLVTGDANVVRVIVAGQDAPAEREGQTLTVALPGTLGPGAQTDVTIRYEAKFNAGGSRRALFMKKGGIIAAYRWIPWLSRKQPVAAPNSGETWVTDVSPRVTVTFTSGKSLVFATSGQRTSASSSSQTFVANNVRDFNFSASPNYRIKKSSANGVRIKVFYRNLPAGKMAAYTAAALKRFEKKVGAYPYRQITVAETPSGSGMESPALSWIPRNTAASRLERLVTHEVAHQWFYATVGNNQARAPFVDEAMASFLTDDMLGSSRISRCPLRDLDRPVYDYSAQCYMDVIYVQGSQYLESYRTEVGGTKFWAGVRQFYSDYAFGIAGTRALLDTLDTASGFNSELHVGRFPSLYP